MLTEQESVVKQMVNSDAHLEMKELEILCERLLRQQPQSKPLLKRLLARSDRAFAVVRDGRCSACNVTIATARAQVVAIGEFINCANCSRFLYCQPLSSVQRHPGSDHSTSSEQQSN